MLESLNGGSNYIFILDEFDRVRSPDEKLYMSDLIKHFSNNPSNITIIIVGVADTVTQLFEDHQSISRCCTQIRMPRMSPDELENIVNERVPRLGMTIEGATKERMIRYSQGLPGYMHLLGQLSARAALEQRTLQINGGHLSEAVDNALEKAEHSTREDYYKAVDSSHPDNTYKEVLLACALAKTNELGRFFAKNLREPYSRIRGKPMDIPNFAPQLGALCETERGPALLRTGKPKRYQYQFANPLLQPLVIMMGVRDGLIAEH
jgi:Cdc6-like AAA superfamily ATPase